MGTDANPKQNDSKFADVQAEKTELEIEELKQKILSYKKNFWEKHFVPAIPLAATILIAVGGWIITNKYNDAQIAITNSKNGSDIEIA